MSTSKNVKKGSAPATTGGADPVLDPVVTSATPADRSWSLAYPKMDVPSPTGLRRITAEVLDADPELLAWLAATHPTCFNKLP